mgnify:CR=1 FL=1
MVELFPRTGFSELFHWTGLDKLFHWRGSELFHRRGLSFSIAGGLSPFNGGHGSPDSENRDISIG